MSVAELDEETERLKEELKSNQDDQILKTQLSSL